MNRRQLFIGGATIGLALRAPSVLAQEDLERFMEQLAMPDGAISRAMRVFEDGEIRVGVFLIIFEDSAATKAYFELERDNIVAYWEDYDLVEGPVEVVFVELQDEDRFGESAFALRRPIDETFFPNGQLTVTAYVCNIFMRIDINDGERFEDLLAFGKDLARLKIDDPASVDELFRLLPTEDQINEAFDGDFSVYLEDLSLRVGEKWEKQD